MHDTNSGKEIFHGKPRGLNVVIQQPIGFRFLAAQEGECLYIQDVDSEYITYIIHSNVSITNHANLSSFSNNNGFFNSPSLGIYQRRIIY